MTRQLIRNAMIVNGDGRTPPFPGDVLIDGDRIAALGAVSTTEARPPTGSSTRPAGRSRPASSTPTITARSAGRRSPRAACRSPANSPFSAA